jgi:phospholipid/cholesterol/gamma-HCH transport system substrate-binding protein
MSKELKIGVFAVTVLVASFFMLNYLRGEDIFNREIEVSSRFEKLEGLVASAPVYIKGYKAGKVSDVTYNTDTEDFIVTCSVAKEFRVPTDSRMIIYSVDIMGSKGVRIEQGQSDIMADDGGVLQPYYEAGLVEEVSSALTPLMSRLENTIDSLGMTISGVNRILSDSNVSSIDRILAHLQSVMADLRSLSKTVKGKSDDIETLITNLSILSADIDKAVLNADAVISNVDTVVTALNSADLTGTVESVKKLLDNINDPDGTVGKLFVDDSIYDSVDSLLNNLDRFVDKIQENPKKYLKISVF